MPSIEHKDNCLNPYRGGLKIDTATSRAPLACWEVDTFFRCPLVGICLTLAEQKPVLKKSGVAIETKSPYEIHKWLVASSESQSRLSQRINHLLNRKYGQAVSHSARLLHPCIFHRIVGKPVFQSSYYQPGIFFHTSHSL